MPRSTTLAAGQGAPLVPIMGAIKTLVAGLEEFREFRHSRSEDGASAPQWVEIRDEVPNFRGMEAQLQAMRYEYQWQRKRWRVWRDSRQLPTFSPDLHEADKPVEELRVSPGASGSDAHPGPSRGGHPGAATLGDFIAVDRRSRAKPRPLPLRRSGPRSNVQSAHRGGPARSDGDGGERWHRQEPTGCGLGLAGAGGGGADSTPPGSEGDGLPPPYRTREGTPCRPGSWTGSQSDSDNPGNDPGAGSSGIWCGPPGGRPGGGPPDGGPPGGSPGGGPPAGPPGENIPEDT